MQKILFARIELWLVLLVGLLALIGMIAFGALVLGNAREGKYGAAGQAAVAIAEIPATVKRLVEPDRTMTAYRPDRFSDIPTGWSFPQGEARAGMPGYLLLSRYDGTARRHKIDLVSLSTYQVLHTWTPNSAALLDGVQRTAASDRKSNWSPSRFREIHPFLTADGDLIVKDHFTPLFRIDACSRREWVQDGGVFHHSTEADADGNLWIPTTMAVSAVPGTPGDFADDEVTEVSQDGKILFKRSLTELLIANGMGMLLFPNERYDPDPVHLNDIQPTFSDGPFWKKGDLFLSLRNLSMILLYRPSTDQIIWTKTGPWQSQHDVDILDDNRISVYNNDVQDRGKLPVYDGSSEVLVYDFRTGTVASPFKAVMEAEEIRTIFAGQFTALPGGRALIEDVVDVRLIIVSEDEKVLARYTNRASDGQLYQLGWSRYIEQDYGDKVVAAVTKVDCNE